MGAKTNYVTKFQAFFHIHTASDQQQRQKGRKAWEQDHLHSTPFFIHSAAAPHDADKAFPNL